jgi:hypothetical protein
MRTIILIFLLFFVKWELFAQVPVFDKLELLYSQEHYRMVYRRANRLLNIPDYDYSYVPEFYKSLSLIQLSQDRHWLIRHKSSLEDAKVLFLSVSSNSQGMSLIRAHITEVQELQRFLVSREFELRKRGEVENANALKDILSVLFAGIPGMENLQFQESEEQIGNQYDSAFRDSLVACAKRFIGVPYVWAGNDPNGFDCSGFTCYVFGKSGKALPRRAVEQFEDSRKVKEPLVQKGDLVFFDNGSGISHVGMLISEKGQPLVMIHASSSQGVVITEIEKSEYWLSRLKGFGTYVY